MLKFPEKKKESMLIDEDPFPPVATINSVTYSLRDPSDARRNWRPRYSHPTRIRSRVYTRYRLPYPQNVWRREPGHQAKPRRDQATQTGPIWDTLGEPSGKFDYLVDYSPKTVFTVTGKPTGWDVMPELEAPKKKKEVRFVLPPQTIPERKWEIVRHKKFPAPLTRTQKRRLQRKRAARRRALLEEIAPELPGEPKNKFSRK